MRHAVAIGAACLVALVAAGAAFALLVRHTARDVGSVGVEAKIPVGSWLTTGDAMVENPSRRFSMHVEAVHPDAGPGMEVTAVHAYLLPKWQHLALGTLPGWPPRDTANRENRRYQAYLRGIPAMPPTVTIPPRGEAQFVFAMRSRARPGTTIRLDGVDIESARTG
jgi:hypothetical protein